MAVVRLRPMAAHDGPRVLAIYQDGIATGHATFEAAAPDWPVFDARFHATPRLVAVIDEAVVGWACLSPTSSRAVYRGVAEVSIYVAAEARGQGVGRTLLTALIEASEAAGFWTLQASLFAENAASVRLHRALGFRVMGVRERIARMSYGPHAGRWRDTTILERRSTRAGID
ncbi:MAG: N-acetyltransferase family protein [Geminicoccaceae bacterium]|nr:MAG: N-acetyltransferase family protein [Geminicoccaceae bacterium]